MHDELKTAFKDLKRQLKSRKQVSPGNLHVHSSETICRTIERFVGQMASVDKAIYELERRATLVSELCSEGSEYASARRMALDSYSGHPKKRGEFHYAIRQLRSQPEAPQFLLEVNAERTNIEVVLREGSKLFIKSSHKYFLDWKHACINIDNASSRFEPDGCRLLYAIYLATSRNPPGFARALRAILTHSSLNSSYFESIDRGAKAIFTWFTSNYYESSGGLPTDSVDQPPITTNRSSRKKKRGRTKVSDETIKLYQSIADEWQRYKDNGRSKAQFIADNKKLRSLLGPSASFEQLKAKLDQILDLLRHRRYGSEK